MNLYVNIKRIDGNKKISSDIRHYLKTLIFKPGALRNLFVLKSNPKLKTIFDKYYTNNPKKFIDIIEKNIQKFNILIAKTLLKRYKNIKSNTPYENFMNLYHSIFEYLKIESKYHIKNEDYDFPSSQIERLKLGVDISEDTYEYLTLVSKNKHKTLNLFNDIMNL